MAAIRDSSDPAWNAAIQFHDIKSLLRHRPRDLSNLRASAVRAVLARAREVVGASKKETRRRIAPFLTRPHAELNIEETLENTYSKPNPDGRDIIVDYKEQKKLDCALMLDTSLSMTGEKLALLAVTAAVLAYKLPAPDFAIVCFESTATTLKNMRRHMPIEKIAAKILEVPAMGYTNIEAGLKEGTRQLARGRHRNRIGILISDGKYTAGNDPVPEAARYRQLHVVLLGDFNTDPASCAAMAASGHGRVYRAASFAGLPRTLNRLLADLLA